MFRIINNSTIILAFLVHLQVFASSASGQADIGTKVGDNANAKQNVSNNNIISNESISNEPFALVDSGYKKRLNLYKELFDHNRYNPLFRPVHDESTQIIANMFLSLVELFSIDDVDQKMTTTCKIVLYWSDELIKWNPEKHGDIEFLAPNLSDIWKPGLSLYNSRERMDVLGFDSKIPPTATDYGTMYWSFDVLLTTSCNLDMDKYPFDVQTCHIEISSATNTKEQVDFFLQDHAFNISLMKKNYGWTVVEWKAQKDYINIENILFPRLTFTLKVKRKSAFVLINDILPTAALSFLTSFIFLLPVESGERISFGMAVLVALAVFLSNTSTKLPSASDGTPAVTQYLAILFANSIVAVILSIVNSGLQQYIEKNNPPSAPRTTHSNATISDTDNNQLDTKDDNILHGKGSSTSHDALQASTSPSATRLERAIQLVEKGGFVIVSGSWIAATAVFFIHVNV